MFKVCILLAVAVACVAAQEVAPENNAAPEPYSYGYQTESHAASEQRDAQGKVTGFYTLVDADGRERRVEYIADESGFRAKVATNEVGTRSSNPADVEILASEPTPGQYVVYQQSPQVQTVQATPAPVVRQQAFTVQQQRVAQVAAPAVRYVQSTTQAYPGYANQALYGTGYNTAYTTGGYYQPGYTYGYGNQAAYGTGYQGLQVGNYNNHLPSQYYRSISSTSTTGAPAVYGQAIQGVQGVQGVRYVNQPAVAGVRSVGYGAVNYGVPAGVSTTTTTRSSNQGSSNYLVLQKRAAVDEKKSS